MVQADGVQSTPQAQDDVAPAFAGGRAVVELAEQAAELAVAAQVPGARYGQFDVVAGEGDSDLAATVTDTASGQKYEVQLEQRPISGVVDSCGKAPKESTAWVAVSVAPVERN